jgi:SAM-dependent methyltransferase
MEPCTPPVVLRADLPADRTRSHIHSVAAHLQRLITPGLKHSQERYRELLTSKVVPNALWLDVGCGHELLPGWLKNSLATQKELVSRCRRAVGVDCGDDRPHVCLEAKYHADAEHLPFGAASFSLVTANMVVEHFANPKVALREIYRVLRPGGLFVFHTPNVRSPLVDVAARIPSRLEQRVASFLDGRKHEAIFPTFYRANSPAAIQSLAASVGFAVCSIDLVETWPVLYMLGPAVLIELLAIRLLRHERLAHLRPDMLVVLQKPRNPLSLRGRLSPPAFSLPENAARTTAIPRPRAA